MALPKQVEQAGVRADEITKEMAGGKPPEVKPDLTPVEPTPPGLGEETIESVKEQLRTAQHKFDVLQGKYNSEIQAIKDDVNLLNRMKNEGKGLKEENRQLSETNARISAELTELKEKVAKLETGSGKTPITDTGQADFSALLNEEEMAHLEREELGGKTLEIIYKLIRANSGLPVDKSDKIEERLKSIDLKVNAVGERVEKTELQKWSEKIAGAIPDFETINQDPKFIEWLENPVSPLSRQTRKAALQEAMNTQDLQSLKLGIDEYKKEAGIKPAPKGKQPPGNLSPPIEPGQSVTTSPSPATGDKKIYTVAEVKKFYTEVATGKWRGREADQAALDRDIVLAQKEGRITP